MNWSLNIFYPSSSKKPARGPNFSPPYTPMLKPPKKGGRPYRSGRYCIGIYNLLNILKAIQRNVFSLILSNMYVSTDRGCN